MQSIDLAHNDALNLVVKRVNYLNMAILLNVFRSLSGQNIK